MIKPINWKMRKVDKVTYFEPEGLIYSYFINPLNIKNNTHYDLGLEKSPLFELAIIDNNGYCNEQLTSLHISLNEAKAEAEGHYKAILRLHLGF
ncbi:MAG: hypothetical protein ACK4M7_09365 [Burkholderiales bacterium]